MSSEDKEGRAQKQKPRSRKGRKAQEATVTVQERKSDPANDERSAYLGQTHKNAAGLAGRTRWRDPITAFTGVLALVGIVQVWAYVQSERAFLSVATMNIDFVADQPLDVFVELRNSGKSPGIVQTLNINLKFLEQGEGLPTEPEYKKGADLGAGLTVVPGDKGWFEATLKGFKGEPGLILNGAQVEGIKGGKYEPRIFGFFTYRDRYSVFLGPTTVGYCVRISHDSRHTPFPNCKESAYTYAH